MTDKINSQIGDVIDVDTGNVIGKHQGLAKYTIGQRKGLNIGGTKDRMYVVGKNVNNNTLYIALGDNNDNLVSDSCLVVNFNQINKEKIVSAKARFRYRQALMDVEIIYLDDNSIIVKYPEGIKAVTPGQYCVLYSGDECLGGGIIKEVRKNEKKIWYL